MKTKTLTPWKTVSLGESKASILKKLEKYEVGYYAKQLLEKVEVSDKQEVDLVVLTPSDLGFTENPTTAELFGKAEELGYDLCPADVGPVLRVNYDDQPKEEYLWIATEPITDSVGYPVVFFVGRLDGDVLWLDGGWAGADGRWRLDERIVFRLRKVQSSGLESSKPPVSLSPSDSAPASLDLLNKKLDVLLNHFGLEQYVK